MNALSVYLLAALAYFPANHAASTTFVQPRQTITTNTTSANSTKAGLGWPNGNTVDMSQYESTGKVSWYYTWSVFPANSTLEFVPMFWGETAIDQFSATINQTLASTTNVTAVLGMNEPDQGGQSNIPPQTGVQLWMTYMEPLRARGLRLGAPRCRVRQRERRGCRISSLRAMGLVMSISLHCEIAELKGRADWYGTDAQAFISYLQDFNATFQKPLWVTEWACQNFVDANAQCSPEDIVQFLNVTQSFMDATDYVERYAWYGAMENTGDVNPSNALMDANGHINALGEQYIAASQPLTASSNLTASNTTSSGGAAGGTSGGDGTLPSIIVSRALSISASFWRIQVVTAVVLVLVALLSSS